MKLSPNFAAYLDEAFKEYTSPDLDLNGLWEPGIGCSYSAQMFLLEEGDFDKAIEVYKHKKFYCKKTIEDYSESKDLYLKTNWDSLEARREFYSARKRDLWGTPDKFVRCIWEDCSYRKQRIGREILDDLLHQLFYSQDDYRLVMDTSSKFYSLCRYWVLQNKATQQQREKSELFSKLQSLSIDLL